MIPIISSPQWGQINYENIIHHSTTYGAVLLKNWCNNVDEFYDIGYLCNLKQYDYIGGAAPRKLVTKKVYTANESPPTESIPFHHELAQNPNPPKYIIFYCDIPPIVDGKTLLLRSDLFFDYLSSNLPSVIRKLSNGVHYTRTMPEKEDISSPIGRSWRDTFLCNTREEAEYQMTLDGMSWSWLPNGDLRTTTKAIPAYRRHTKSGKYVFHNSIIAASMGWKDTRNDPTKAVTYADGSPFNAEDIKCMHDYTKKNQIKFNWQKNDVLIVDNYLMMHARQPFPVGSKRRILVSLWD